MIGLFAATPEARLRVAELAGRLGPDAVLVDGPIGAALRRVWFRLGAAVLFVGPAEGARLLAPLLRDRFEDPDVVCVDLRSGFAVSLAGTGDAVLRAVADQLEITPVPGGAAVDNPVSDLVRLFDATAVGDLDACAAAVLDGLPVMIVNPWGFPLPPLPDNVSDHTHGAEWIILVDDRVNVPVPRGNLLRVVPRTLVVGVDSFRGVPTTAVTSTLSSLAADHSLDPRAVRAFATVDVSADERGTLEALEDWGFWHGEDQVAPPLLAFPAATLSTVEVPESTAVVRAEVGTPSVAEAVALHAAAELADGARVELATPKTKGDKVTVAVARILPRSRVAVLALSAGGPCPPAVEFELRRSTTVLGSAADLARVGHLLHSGTRQQVVREGAVPSGAVAIVHSGRRPAVALGDDVEVVVVAAACPAAAGDDHLVVDLSGDRAMDRVRGAATDLPVCLEVRAAQPVLVQAVAALRTSRGPEVVVLVNSDGEQVWSGVLGELRPDEVPSSAVVLVGVTADDASGP